MEDFVNEPCDENDVACLYNIFNARDPEEGHPWVGVSKYDLLKSINGPGEFQMLCGDILRSGYERLVEDRNADIEGEIPAFLARLGAPPPRSDTWPDFFLSGILLLKDILGKSALSKRSLLVANNIRRTYKAKSVPTKFYDDILQFNEEWFWRANAGIQNLRGAPRWKTLVAFMVVKGDAEISPYFQLSGPSRSGLRDQIFGTDLEPSEYTLEEVLDRVEIAFREGLLTHWLFQPDYYVSEREQAFAGGRVKRWTPDANPFVDFLAHGDENGIRPHWMFCPTAYDLLNPDVDTQDRPFHHFVTFGQFQELRTLALFDPHFYKTMNPTMLLDVNSGKYMSLLESFCLSSYPQHVQFSPDFDAGYYLFAYRDVVPDNVHVLSAAHHFLIYGVKEGRNPNPYFDYVYMTSRYPWIGDTCRKLAITPLEYFLLIGRHDNMRAARPLADRGIDMLQAKALYERRAKDAHIRLTRKPLDFSGLVGKNPALSVIVPVHNQLEFTARFLELAYYGAIEIKRRCGQTLEIIIVSNGSTDRTAELLAATKGIKYVDEAKALGYPGAANVGAAMATGELVLVVNNDIEFEPGVFADLVESYRSIPNCGAIGPRILSMDLTVQEIGAFIGGDGSTFGFARGERSSYNSNSGIDQVDYVSGCFLCLSRADFEHLGGFDDAFSPGYYEEVDLCFRLKKALGKSVFVNPDITITHYEHASFMKGRPPAVSYPTILRNRKRLLSKHSEIGLRPPVDKIMGAAGITRLGRPKSRVLVIEDLVPDLRLGSGFGRAAEVLRTFHKLGVAYDVIALNPTVKIDEYEFGDVMLYRHWMPEESLEAILNRSPGIYSHIWVCRSHNLPRFYEIFKAHKNQWDTTIVCDTEAVSVQRTIELAKLQGNAPTAAEISDLVAAEFNASAIVDQFIAVNERDAGFIRSVGLHNVSIISHTVSSVVRSTRPWKERSRLLFVGAVHSPLAPNFDSLNWFLRGGAKMIKEHGKRLTCVGYWDEAVLREFTEANPLAEVDFMGMVSEKRLSELYDEALVTLAPTRYSAGIPCKVVESMLVGTPIVMTDLLADQIGATGDTRARLAVAKRDSDGQQFSQAVSRLITDEKWWNTVRNTQIDYARTRFNQEVFDGEVRAVLEKASVRWRNESWPRSV
ncbi:glycosyltransferase [Sphingomonas sp. UYEF23]|uniref:glycosyltransferase n=1 Tax=Sphingomonas sp. UYEF23 TaxID=1756408 RepID=UPI00339AB01A